MMASPRPPAAQVPPQEVFLEFRAGKMAMEGRTVKPDTRKGLIRIIRGDEGLLHFQWLDRTRNIPEDDQIIFPEEAIFEKVQQSSGRVYILKFKHDDRTFFFWMQEPKGDGDAQICSSVNFYINRPLELEQDEEAEGVAPPTLSETSGSVSGLEVSSREASVEMMVPPPGNASVGDAVAVEGPVQLADLKRILSSIGQSGPQSEIPLTLPRDTGPSLAEILKPELVVPLLENCHLEEQLVPYLPEGPWTRETIIELMQSPQFHQQLEAFTEVLRSGQIDLAQFGIDPSKCDFTVSSFLEAIEDQVSGQTEPTPLSRDKRTDSEDDKNSDENAKSKNERDRDAMEEGR